VVIENRAGAGGNIGAETVAKARPDGYTIVCIASGLTISPSLYKKKLNYDLIKDFAPISLAALSDQVVIVRPNLPVKNFKEFVEYAKANPGKLNYGSSGKGVPGHLAGELLNSLAKINIANVPYKGAGPAMTALMGGEIDMAIFSVTGAISQIQDGKVRALAVLSNKRASPLPNVPTAKEAGIDNFVVTTWIGILAPAGTPRDIVNRLNAELIRIVAMPDTLKLIQNAGLEPISNTPEQFAELIKEEIELWSKVIKDANIEKID
jgi:tripartite-type tricarboxylate transporter receptor subunit TctC